jgi:exopolyphosphatase/pppGpp-phosphohydrolase
MPTTKAGIIKITKAMIQAMNPFKMSFHQGGLKLGLLTELKESSNLFLYADA